jgi:hypothetical protein
MVAHQNLGLTVEVRILTGQLIARMKKMRMLASGVLMMGLFCLLGCHTVRDTRKAIRQDYQLEKDFKLNTDTMNPERQN